MIVSAGQFALQLALACSFILLVWRHVRLAQVMACLVGFSFLTLMYAFVTNDFSVIYVANNSNSTLPLIYRLCAVWGAHEGSMLLWALILAGWIFAVVTWGGLTGVFRSRVIMILALINIGFLTFILFTSNPFTRAAHFFPLDGADLNPLLQDPGLISHPPILYMGYVGFAVPFAFALAALMAGKADAAWAKLLRPWVWTAWAFLTVGIVLGSWWAYYELGWGGWWFWDPVENASFMPWLVGAALLHAVMVTSKQGTFAKWTIFLAISAFSLSLLGTFLVRSGVLTSVHAFATDPTRGLFILIYLSIVIGGALLLFALRGARIQVSLPFSLFSREAVMLYGGALLAAAAASILLGTIYPLIADAIWEEKLSVGPPYFNAVFIPFMVPVMALMALVPTIAWGKASASKVLNANILLMVISAGFGMGLAFYYQSVALLLLGLSLWIALATLKYVYMQIRQRQFTRRSASMLLAHVGLAASMAGIVLVTQFDIEQDVAMSVGDKVTVGDYEFHLSALKNITGPNYKGVQGTFHAKSLSGRHQTTLYPEKRFFIPREMPMSETALDPGFIQDLYVALGEPLMNDQWSVRIYIKPFVRWIWFGGLFMALGALIGVRR